MTMGFLLALIFVVLAFLYGTAVLGVVTPGIYFLLEHKELTLGYALVYVALGGIWSVFKWFYTQRAYARVKRAQWEQTTAKTPESKIVPWDTWKQGYIHPFSYYKTDIAVWVVFWPISILYSIFSDLLSEVATWVVEKMKGVYEAINEYVWR